MAYWKIEDDIERAVYRETISKAMDGWRHENKINVANGIGLAFGGDG